MQKKIVIIILEDNRESWLYEFNRYGNKLGIITDQYPNISKPEDYHYSFVWKPPADLLNSFTKLKAVFSLGAGVDHIFDETKLSPEIPVIKMVNQHLTETMSEYVVLQCLFHLRRFYESLRLQKQKLWSQFIAPKASDMAVGIMGAGVLGQDAAKKLRIIGFQVNCYSRTPKKLAGVKCYHGTQMDEFLQNTDILVGLLPLTKQTKGIFNYSLFSRLRQRHNSHTPVFINAGRGALHNEKDIFQALQDKVLYAASLDVFEKEPLDVKSPLWQHPLVFITPHIAAVTSEEFAARYVIDMINNNLKGEKWQNVIDPSQQY